jgi:hypothetical protein
MALTRAAIRLLSRFSLAIGHISSFTGLLTPICCTTVIATGHVLITFASLGSPWWW